MPAREASIPRDPLAATIRAHERAITLREAGQFATAERACRRALAGYEKVEGPRHPDVANALVELGTILEGRDRLREAARCHRRALSVLDGATEDPDVARLALRARLLMAGIDRALGAYQQAERGYLKVLAETRRRFGPRDPYVAGTLNNLGVLRKAQGRYAEAAAAYRRALPLVSRRDVASLATLAHNLGGIEHARGRYAQAEPHARRSVRLRTKLLGPDHPAVAADVAALAAIVEGRDRFEEAAGLYQQALAVFRRHLGPRSLEVGLGLASLAAVEQRQGRLTAARKLYGQAVTIQEAVLGRRHVDVALTINNLAVLERDDGNLDRAYELFRRATTSFSAAVGPRHPHTLLAEANRRAVATERSRSESESTLKGRRHSRR